MADAQYVHERPKGEILDESGTAMTQRMADIVAAALGCLLLVSIANIPASACACCSNRGSRHVATEKLDPQRLAAIDQMTFGKSARLYVGESDGEETRVEGFGSELTLEVERQKTRILFTFRNKQGRTGTATLVMPRTLSIFEVDPHGDSKDEGLGPSLYKEWTLTAPAAVTGILRRTGGQRATMSLILHGGGRGCTDATHFTHWTLHIRRPNGQTIFFGPLESATP
jgi:hypothetical protein